MSNGYGISIFILFDPGILTWWELLIDFLNIIISLIVGIDLTRENNLLTKEFI